MPRLAVTSRTASYLLVPFRCFYHDFFARHEALDVIGPIFCAADLKLFEAAAGKTREALRRGIGGAKVSLEASLAQGHGSCRFVIEKTSE